MWGRASAALAGAIFLVAIIIFANARRREAFRGPTAGTPPAINVRGGPLRVPCDLFGVPP